MVTDLELFDRRLAYFAEQYDDAAIGTLRDALELVEGPVFTYQTPREARSSGWTPRTGSAPGSSRSPTRRGPGHRCLDTEDLDGAVWAARPGLDASHIHTRLTKLLMQAYFAKGRHPGSGAGLREPQSALEQLELDDVDGELVEFFQSARQGRTAAAS